jgi:hypothetical protein
MDGAGMRRRWQWLSKKPAQKALRELSRLVNELINREGGGRRGGTAAEQDGWDKHDEKKTAITEQKA